MDLTRYVDSLRQEFVAAAETGDEASRELAERLVAPLSSVVRLALLEALSAAADEITRDLAPGSVEIRLRGLDPSFVVTLPPTAHGFDDKPEEDFSREENSGRPALSAVASGDDGATSRINFRPPEYLKARIEEAASRERLSVNAWLVRAVSEMLETENRSRVPERRAARGSSQFSGWVN
ncbi:hypothetical protein ACFU9Y_22135 [Streptomyces sp. NPDC057621]|uniref:Histidine kinase n=1 Tax=Streptomyces liliiviolaceus TaxID=2823109 RepID=A0A940Y117_9ACTN|nr:hypothetical protein [Streptomyces liliiviolaceus]MBQ0853726.1 hypothetical protein [Streptomyces liliiviolaceus]